MALINELLEDLIKRGGSDLHLAASGPPLARVRGEIVALRQGALGTKMLDDMLRELVTPAQWERFEAAGSLDAGIAFEDIARLRVRLYRKHEGVAAAFRLVPARVPSLAELGCPDIFWRLAGRSSGLLLVSGPGSNGKTTMAAALVDHVNKTRPCHVVTIEDPIEFVHEPLRAQVTQREVPTHAPSIAASLRSIRRDDPDVVYVSTLDSPEVIELALQLAVDGLLVIATYPASSAVAALERIVTTCEPHKQARVRSLLADAIAGVLVQHLVRGVDGKSQDESRAAGRRLAVHEILIGTPPIATIVREGKPERLADAIKGAEAHGMQLLDAALDRLLSAGKISAEVALERSIDKEAFSKIVAKLRPDLVDAP